MQRDGSIVSHQHIPYVDIAYLKCIDGLVQNCLLPRTETYEVHAVKVLHRYRALCKRDFRSCVPWKGLHVENRTEHLYLETLRSDYERAVRVVHYIEIGLPDDSHIPLLGVESLVESHLGAGVHPHLRSVRQAYHDCGFTGIGVTLDTVIVCKGERYCRRYKDYGHRRGRRIEPTSQP